MKKLGKAIYIYMIAMLQFILSINLVWKLRIYVNDYRSGVYGVYFLTIKFLFLVLVFYVIISFPKIVSKLVDKSELKLKGDKYDKI